MTTQLVSNEHSVVLDRCYNKGIKHNCAAVDRDNWSSAASTTVFNQDRTALQWSGAGRLVLLAQQTLSQVRNTPRSFLRCLVLNNTVCARRVAQTACRDFVNGPRTAATQSLRAKLEA